MDTSCPWLIELPLAIKGMERTQKLGCLACEAPIPKGRRAYCSDRCRERLARQRYRLKKRGKLVSDKQALQYLVPKEQYRKAQMQAEEISREWSTYVQSEAELLGIVDEYREKNDELHETVLALHRELRSTRTHAIQLAVLVARMAKQTRTTTLDAGQTALVRHYLAMVSTTAPPPPK